MLALAALVCSASAVSITLSGSSPVAVYDGHGGLSAGASSRLLKDYAEPQRSQILDYLWKPQFGAGLHMCKIEVGGDTQSTDGTEPSPQHYRGEAPDCSLDRGYELWLLSEAHKRNPDVQSYLLSWGVPRWVGNGTYFSQENIDYQVNYATCVKQTVGRSPDYIGSWNERYWGGTDYIIRLRSALNTAGHTATRIVVPDGGGCSDVSQAALANASFASAVYALGEHYPCKRSCPAAVGAGLAFWASEDFSTVSDWNGAGCWGRSLSQNWVLLNSTSTISWSTIWSVYPKDSYFGNGLMYAFSPWSGSYTVNPAIWTSAHHTQFMQVGWHLLQGPAGKGLLPGGGSYVTATSPDLTQFTLVLESLQGNCLRCSGGPTQPQNLTFTLTNGLPAAGSALKVWQTTEAAPFVALPDVTVSPSGTLTVFLPADAMLTVSTIATAQHGDFPATPIPSDAPFPLPYSDTFEGVAEDSLPRYFADQAGSFAVRAGVVQQVVGEDPGPNGWVENRQPVTFIGDAAWTDVAVSVDVRFNSGPPDGQLQAGVPLSRSPLGAGEAAALAPCSPQLAPYQAWAFSAVAPGYLSSSSPSPTCLNAPGCSPTLPLIYWDCVTTGCECGCPSFTNLQWAFNASTGALSSGMDGRQCVTLAADGSLVLRACAPGQAPGQRWAHSASSGQLTLPPLAGGTPLCLTAPAPAPGYAGITARMATYQTRTPGYQFLAVEGGSWRLLAAQAVIANGTLAPGFNSSATHTLGFTVKGSTLTGSVDGAQVFSVQDSTFGAGQVGLGSGYHYAAFDNFSVKPAA